MSRRVARSNWDYRGYAPSLGQELANVWNHQTRCATWVSSLLRHVTVSRNWAYGYECSGPRYEQNSITPVSSDSDLSLGSGAVAWVETVLQQKKLRSKQCHPIDQQPRCWAPDSGAEGLRGEAGGAS
jgi:hypothetical protein